MLPCWSAVRARSNAALTCISLSDCGCVPPPGCALPCAICDDVGWPCCCERTSCAEVARFCEAVFMPTVASVLGASPARWV